MHDDRPLDSRKILIRQLCWCVGYGRSNTLQLCLTEGFIDGPSQKIKSWRKFQQASMLQDTHTLGEFLYKLIYGSKGQGGLVKSFTFAMRSWTFHSLQMRWQRGLFGILEFMVIDIDDSGDDDHDHEIFSSMVSTSIQVWAKTQSPSVELFWLRHIKVLASTSLVSRPLRMRISSFSFSSPFFAFLCRRLFVHEARHNGYTIGTNS